MIGGGRFTPVIFAPAAPAMVYYKAVYAGEALAGGADKRLPFGTRDTVFPTAPPVVMPTAVPNGIANGRMAAWRPRFSREERVLKRYSFAQ